MRKYILIYISVAREQLGKHVPAKKNSWPTIGKWLSIASQRAVNKFRQQQRPCFLCGPCRAYIRSSEDCSEGFSSGRRRWRQFSSWLFVCHRNGSLESVITNCSYDVWNYPINRVIKSGTHHLLSRYQDTRDNIYILERLNQGRWDIRIV
jgi:hypothetical protein